MIKNPTSWIYFFNFSSTVLFDLGWHENEKNSKSSHFMLRPGAWTWWCLNLQGLWWRGCKRGSTCRKPFPTRCCCRCSGGRRSWPTWHSTQSWTSWVNDLNLPYVVYVPKSSNNTNLEGYKLKYLLWFGKNMLYV